MAWPDQRPPATDVILHVDVPCAGTGPASPTYLEIDKLADGLYRATGGTLFEHQEVCRTRDLEACAGLQKGIFEELPLLC